MPELEIEDPDLPQAAVVLVWRPDGTILGVSRPDDPTAFTLPGGHVDEGEDPAAAAARELREETGVELSELVQVFQGVSDGTLCTAFEGKAVPLEEFAPRDGEKGIVKWCTPRELLDGPFGEYNRLLFLRTGISF
jgi:8-oxo-dGTP pyrophosphatase MutT (NUDIX family)